MDVDEDGDKLEVKENKEGGEDDTADASQDKVKEESSKPKTTLLKKRPIGASSIMQKKVPTATAAIENKMSRQQQNLRLRRSLHCL